MAMRPSEAVHRHRAKIKEIALGHRVADVRIFGSAARGDDVEGSDLDLLVEPTAVTMMVNVRALRPAFGE